MRFYCYNIFMNFSKKIALDMAIIFIPAVIITLWVYFSFSPKDFFILNHSFVENIISNFVGRNIKILLLSIFALTIIKTIFSLIVSKKGERVLALKGYIHTVAYIFILLIGSIAIGYSTSTLFNGAQSIDVISATKTLVSIENSVFPINAVFLLHLLPIPLFIEILISWSYLHIFFVLIATFILVFVFNPSDFRKLVMTIAITPFLFFPFWILFPATSPEGFYVENIFEQSFSDSETMAINKLERSEYTEGVVRRLNETWIAKDDSYLNVSSIPSLHASWGLILAFFAIRVRKSLGIFYIPWFVLNTVGTFYLFQHFIADAVIGVLFSAVILWVFVREEE